MHDTLPSTPPAAETTERPAYNPTPSIPRLLTELTAEEFWYRYARVRGDGSFSEGYLTDRKRTALLLRAVLADLVALADPANARAAADAAMAANAVRYADLRGALPAEAARAWLREEYQLWEESPAPHPPNCPGGCGGSGEVLQILTWQADDGVPLHEEPVRCNRGEPEDPHAPDCVCQGTGFTYDARHDERDLCLSYTPRPRSAPRGETSPDDPWSSEPAPF